MEQNTEASQAVDERPLFEQTMNDMRFFPRELDFTMTKSPSGRDEYANAHLQSCWVGWNARATLKAQPAPTEAQELSPVYAWLERSTRNSPAEVANAARTMMAFYQGAEFPAAQGHYMVRMTVPDAMRIVKANWPNIVEIERAFFANIPHVLAAQGEDSARLEFGEITSVVHNDRGAQHTLMVYFKTTAGRDEFRDVFGAMVLKDRARARAETGGVKR